MLNIIQWHLQFYRTTDWHVGPSSSGLGYFGVFFAFFYYYYFPANLWSQSSVFLLRLNSHWSQLCLSKNCNIRPFVTESASSDFIFSHKSVNNSVSKDTLECLPISFSIHPPCFLLLWPHWSDIRTTYSKIQDSESTRCLWSWTFYWILHTVCLLTRVWKGNRKWCSSEPFLRQTLERGNMPVKTHSHGLHCCTLDSRVYCSFNQFGLGLQSYIP